MWKNILKKDCNFDWNMITSVIRFMLLFTFFMLTVNINALHHTTIYHWVSLIMSSSILISFVERCLIVKFIFWQSKNMQSCKLWKSLKILWLIHLSQHESSRSDIDDLICESIKSEQDLSKISESDNLTQI